MSRVLIADDEESMRTLVARAIAMDGHETVTAEDGAEALEIIARENGAFDLLLTDIQMPVMDGVALPLAAARDYPRLVILLMTGFADQRERASGLEAIVRRHFARAQRQPRQHECNHGTHGNCRDHRQRLAVKERAGNCNHHRTRHYLQRPAQRRRHARNGSVILKRQHHRRGNDQTEPGERDEQQRHQHGQVIYTGRNDRKHQDRHCRVASNRDRHDARNSEAPGEIAAELRRADKADGVDRECLAVLRRRQPEVTDIDE